MDTRYAREENVCCTRIGRKREKAICFDNLTRFTYKLSYVLIVIVSLCYFLGQHLSLYRQRSIGTDRRGEEEVLARMGGENTVDSSGARRGNIDWHEKGMRLTTVLDVTENNIVYLIDGKFSVLGQ